MKAVQIKEFGDVDVLEEIDAPTPKILKKQVLIKNHAVAIDPYDVKFIQGLAGEADKLPLIPGSSVIG
ncbi:MAG: NADP-dependent oxidoreductase, partial [Weissella cibaria]